MTKSTQSTKFFAGLRMLGLAIVVAAGFTTSARIVHAAVKTTVAPLKTTATTQTKKTTPSSTTVVTKPVVKPASTSQSAMAANTTPASSNTAAPITGALASQLSSNGGTTTATNTTATAPTASAGTTSSSVSNPSAKPKISFTFDDSYASAYTQAQPTLAKYGLTGTDYVITGCVGMTTAPNSCHANNTAQYMTWAQIVALQTDGWEIGSHTLTHPYLASSDATDSQPNVLTPAQVTKELTQSRSDLAAHGITATDFSSPYGDYSMPVLAQIAKYYASHRGFADTNNNEYPYNDLLLNDFQVQEGVTVAQVESKINDAIANNRWLILTMHDIQTKPSTNPADYQYSTAELDQIAAYVKAKQAAGLITATNINQGLVTSSSNLLTNSSFNAGISGGWRTDSPTTITADAANNGSYPDPTNSVKLTNGTSNVHLFSPQVAVDSNTTYLLKSFLNVQAITSGEVAFYVDEYDANGNWLSGQYLKRENSVYVEDLNFTYRPATANVKKASLQVIVAGTGITAYLDNTQWFPLQTTTPAPSPPPTPTPAPTPTPTPTPAPTNLVVNGTFDNGIADGWTTDDATNITADAANNGGPNNPVHSIHMIAGAKNNHLFSPKIPVTPTKQYSLRTYLSLKANTGGEVAFYIDEYDANGKWVSGQYKVGVQALSNGDVTFTYQPTSATVASASLQVIVVSNSGIQAYVDDVRWYQN